MLIPGNPPGPAPPASDTSAPEGGEIEADPSSLPKPAGVLLDVTGTLLDPDGNALPGAVEAIGQMQSAGLCVAVASNLTSTTGELLHQELSSKGFSLASDCVVTTACLTKAYLQEHYRASRVMVLADGAPFPPGCDFELVDDAPDVIVLGGVGDWLSKEALNTVIGSAAEGVPLIAMHRNLCWQTPSGLALDLGGLLPGIEAASGCASYLTGKPAPAFFERAMEIAGMDPARALMVGDDIATDVLAAQDVGLTGVLVRTGKVGAEALGGRAPDFVIDSIADLPGLLREGK